MGGRDEALLGEWWDGEGIAFWGFRGWLITYPGLLLYLARPDTWLV